MERWVFLGNPGAGKSTLANCLAGMSTFPAGLSMGSGKTMRTQSAESHGVLLIDTPGLADTALQHSASAEITKALQLAASGPCKLFFVATLRSGRVRSEDVTSMNIILSSIATPGVSFTVIINHVQREQYKRLVQGGEELQAVTACICSGPFTTPFILVVPELSQLVEKENALVELPPEITRFFREQAPSLMFKPAMVRPIPPGTNLFESLMASTQALIHTYTRDNQAARARIEELSQATPNYWDTLCKMVMAGVRFWLLLNFGVC